MAETPGNPMVLERLRNALQVGQAVAFVGAGASVPLYPLWQELVVHLIERVRENGAAPPENVEDWRAIADRQPLEVASEIKSVVGEGVYRQTLRTLFARRTGADGRPFTRVHGALARLPFCGYLTTNYDPGLLLARQEVLGGGAAVTPSTWCDLDAVDAWITGRATAEGTAPILFAHGFCERTDTIILGADDYDRAYRSSPYLRLLQHLWSQKVLVFVGFGFADEWVRRIVGDALSETRAPLVAGPRHIAVLGLEASRPYTAQLRDRVRRLYNADAYFYPVQGPPGARDHGALVELLEALAAPAPASVPISASGPAASRWSSPPVEAPTPGGATLGGAATKDRLSRVLGEGVLRCGCVKHPPFADFAWVEGVPTFAGLYVDMCRVVESRSGLRVELHPVDWSELEVAFDEHLRLDLVLSVFETRKRLAFADFTAPFYTIGVSGVAKAGDLRFASAGELQREEVRVVVTKGEIGWEYALYEAGLPRRRLVVMETSDLTEMAALVSGGSVDLAICDDLSCATMVERDPALRRVFSERPLYLCKNSIMVPRGEPQFCEWILGQFRAARKAEEIATTEAQLLDRRDVMLSSFI